MKVKKLPYSISSHQIWEKRISCPVQSAASLLDVTKSYTLDLKYTYIYADLSLLAIEKVLKKLSFGFV